MTGHPTKNTLPESTRVELAGVLNELLASLIDLSLQAKQAHWNIRGLSFIALHEMCEEFYDELAEKADLVAERIVQLGGIAQGTVQTVASGTTLAPYLTEKATAAMHLEVLSTAAALLGGEFRTKADKAAELGDSATNDILIEVTRSLDAWLWKLEAHLGE